jgi:hypothetical protein
MGLLAHNPKAQSERSPAPRPGFILCRKVPVGNGPKPLAASGRSLSGLLFKKKPGRPVEAKCPNHRLRFNPHRAFLASSAAASDTVLFERSVRAPLWFKSLGTFMHRGLL